MIRIAICDDDFEMAEQIENLVDSFQQKHAEEIETDIFYSGEKLREEIKQSCPYEIMLMDIEMKGLNGVDVGHMLRADENNDLVQLIYISSHEKYHMQLFDVQPSGFISKPIQPDLFERKLVSAIQKIKRRSKDNRRRLLRLQQKGSESLIPFKDIIYLESNSRKIILHTKTEQIEYYSTLNKENEKLFSDEFIRTHQSYIINFYHVKQITSKKIVLLNGLELPISERYVASVKKSYLTFRGNLIG
ncbi:two component transcriptional regulator, LytTR family [Paenibacillus uliginis N3/975]|uniref:Two component transcriptional regulator, LytTR family n=1 Tax=Paenibacillus uliginis N3/975 TaxID=1313296 RepID=A0A1X7HQV0_9BACL|nr:LytTR family DNA-binding domain-containing protein [Paenibacillus uliginis]SMF90327.1 two component transcriptional regulator, LytTR family [Paenibacillus uliginis N3/975]